MNSNYLSQAIYPVLNLKILVLLAKDLPLPYQDTEALLFKVKMYIGLQALPWTIQLILVL